MLNSRENLKIHPRSGETHAGLERRREGQAQIDGCFAGPGLRLPRGQLALRPRSRPAGVQPQPLYQHLWGPPRAVPAGTRSSRPGFLGDCCQVRNSKAEFIILADNWRCSSPELLPDRAPALCRAGPSSVGGASGSPRGKAVPGAQGLLGPWHRFPEGGTCFGAISACWSVAGKGRRRNHHRDRGEAQMDVGWRAALPWLP